MVLGQNKMLKLVIKNFQIFMGFYSAIYTLYFPEFQNKMAAYSPFLGYPYIFLFNLF